MIFAGIDVNIITHAKALAAGMEAFGLWSWCMCYAQLQETDGRIERVALLSALGEKPKVLRRALVRLLTSSLLIENADGSFQLHNYGKKNQSADEIRRKKDLTAERVRLWRERRGNAAGNADVTQRERVRTDPEPEPPPDNTTRKQVCDARPRVERLSVTEPILEAPDLTPALRAIVAQVCDPSGVTLDADHEWLTFVAHSAREARPVTPAGWKYWLCNAAKFAKRDRVRDGTRAAAGSRLVQSGDNRAWKVPEEMP